MIYKIHDKIQEKKIYLLFYHFIHCISLCVSYYTYVLSDMDFVYAFIEFFKKFFKIYDEIMNKILL